MESRVMYIEDTSGALIGPARIGRVTFSKPGRTVYYQGRALRRVKGAGTKANIIEVATGAPLWISGPHKDGADTLYGGSQPVTIDADVAEEHWRDVRGTEPPGSRRSALRAHQRAAR